MLSKKKKKKDTVGLCDIFEWCVTNVEIKRTFIEATVAYWYPMHLEELRTVALSCGSVTVLSVCVIESHLMVNNIILLSFA